MCGGERVIEGVACWTALLVVKMSEEAEAGGYRGEWVVSWWVNHGGVIFPLADVWCWCYCRVLVLSWCACVIIQYVAAGY